MYQLVDFNTKQPVTTDDFVFTGDADHPWEVQMNLDEVKNKLYLESFKQTTPCLGKYLPFMPVNNVANFVSLSEMATPLVKSRYFGEQLGVELFFKVEGKMPTGSFKDRGSAVELSVAKELGAKAVILASTGNMAASCACYAAAAGLPCIVLVPEGVPMAKLAQVVSYGGHVYEVKGSYNDAAELAERIAREQNYYLAGDYAFRVEGQKTAAFELVDQLEFNAPDAVFVPIGCGTNITAYEKGFSEYFQLGLTDKRPRLFGVQAAGSAAVVNSFMRNSKTVRPLDTVDTLATAISVPNPIDGEKALSAIYNTNGAAYAVSDEEILETQQDLAKHECLFVETSSAATLASLKKAVKEQNLVGKRVVCVLSGEGLKDANVVLKFAPKPRIIDCHHNLELRV
jgi:threonine synthase